MQGDIRGMKIAVIGGGAGCVAFLHHFVDLIGCREAKFIIIKVYESAWVQGWRIRKTVIRFC